MITAGIDVGSSAVKAVLLDIGTEQARTFDTHKLRKCIIRKSQVAFADKKVFVCNS